MGKTYLFYQLNAQYLLQSCTVQANGKTKRATFLYNVSDGLALDCFSQVCSHRNCPLFDQLRLCANKNFNPDDKERDEKALMRELVFLDFSSLNLFHSVSQEEIDNVKAEPIQTAQELYYAPLTQKLFHLFAYGFVMQFADGETVTFVPSERGASMTRNRQMTFVRRERWEEMERRTTLNLRVDHDKIPVNLSKYYAYRGLMLSDAERCGQHMNPYLNESAVIVIDDERSFSEMTQVITNRNPDKNGYFTAEIKEKQLNFGNLFDGQGLMSDRAAQAIQNDLNVKAPITAVQFRLPFAKGLLHRVNFHDFLKKYICFDTDYKSMEIVDAFGIPRRIADAEIILTKAQFKAFRWLKDYAKAHDVKDIMRWYFTKLDYYKHAFYAVRTNLSLHGSAHFSYQFINTLDMDCDAFTNVINPTLEPLRQSEIDLNDPAVQSLLDRFMHSDNYEWMEPLKKNPHLLAEKPILDAFRLFCKAQLKNISIGKVPIQGSTLFLCRDLLGLMMHITSLLRPLGSAQEGSKEVRENIEKLRANVLFRERFFAPGVNNLNPDFYYAVYRSPHLSRNETCALRPYSARRKIRLHTAHGKTEMINPYQMYFSKLKNALMIACDSVAASTLAGADFDGDTVVLVDDKRINKAVLRGAYQKKDASGALYERRIPIIEIRGAETEEIKLHEDLLSFVKEQFLPYFVNSAGDSTGIVSNAAISVGKWQYSERDFCALDKMKSNRAAKVWENTCRNPAGFAGILAGLEIDAAKTGRHPAANIREMSLLADEINRALPQKKDQPRGKDYYLSLIDKREGALYRFDVKKGAVEDYKLLTKGKSVSVASYDSNGFMIDNLPSFFAKYYEQVDKKKVANAPHDAPLFDFDAAKVKPPTEEEKAAVRRIADTYLYYRKIRNSHLDDNMENETDSPQRSILLGLNEKFDTAGAFLDACGTTAARSLSSLLSAFLEEGEEKAEAALQRMQEVHWQYLGDQSTAARMDALAYILDDLFDKLPREQMEALFCDFRLSGYRFLYYFLMFAKRQNSYLHIDAEKEFDAAQCPDEALFKTLCALYNTCTPQKIRSDTEEFALLRRTVLAVFENEGTADVQRALRCCRSLPQKQRNALFWDIFTGSEMAENVTSGVPNGEHHAK